MLLIVLAAYSIFSDCIRIGCSAPLPYFYQQLQCHSNDERKRITHIHMTNRVYSGNVGRTICCVAFCLWSTRHITSNPKSVFRIWCRIKLLLFLWPDIDVTFAEFIEISMNNMEVIYHWLHGSTMPTWHSIMFAYITIRMRMDTYYAYYLHIQYTMFSLSVSRIPLQSPPHSLFLLYTFWLPYFIKP